MKRKISRLAGVIIAMLMVCCPINLLAATEEALDNDSHSVASDEDEIIANDESGIPDVNLYNVVLKAGDTNQDGVLTKSEAAGITELYAARKGISSIKGIEYLTGLGKYNLGSPTLVLDGNPISDFSPLKELELYGLSLCGSQITDISFIKDISVKVLLLGENCISDINALRGMEFDALLLCDNQIQDISPLADVKVRQLYLQDNEISDIGPLKGKSLSVLGLDNNSISDISALSDILVWQILSLSGNEIRDISPLADMNFSEINFYSIKLANNQISDISALAGIMKFSLLDLSNNQISDISVLEGKSFDELYLDHNKISDISSLTGIKNIRHLYLSDNQISDISILNGMNFTKATGQFSFFKSLDSYDAKRLYNVDLSNNKIENLNGLSGRNCERINLSNNEISDISVISEIEGLNVLDLSGNKITDISKLAEVTDLKYLNMANNQIEDITPLAGQVNLCELDLSGNQIHDINALSQMSDLCYLILSDNQISSIDGLPEMKKLSKLHLSHNQISDISLIRNVSFVGSAGSLDLSYNMIEDVEPIRNLKSLWNLDLSYNQIHTIKYGFCMDAAGSLNLSHNFISDVSHILPSGYSVTELDLTYNQISDITPIKRLFKFPSRYSFAYYDSDGKLNKYFNIAEGNLISKENAVKCIPEEVLYFNVYKWNPVTEEYEPTNETWLDTEPFIEDPADKEKEEKQVEDFVNRLYSLILDRTADQAGIDSWKNALLKKESSGVDAGYGFVFSPECVERNLSNADFVEMLYNTFMNREADEGGKSAWISQLESGVEREKILEGFIMSAEFGEICKEYGISVGRVKDVEAFDEALSHYCNQNADVTAFVARCYTKALGREYDPIGLEDWCRVIVTQDDTPTSVAKSFIFSDEFTGKNLGDEEYVKVLYRTFMGREADEGGLSGWIAVLESGEEDREKVLEGFADSLEFAEILEEFGLE